METFFESYGSANGEPKPRTMSTAEVNFRQFLADNIDALVAADLARRAKMNKWDHPNYPATVEAHLARWESRVADSYIAWQFDESLRQLQQELAGKF